MQSFLKKNKQSYYSYICNLYNGHIYGDNFVLMAIAHMWNIKITVVLADELPHKIGHEDDGNPNVVVIYNNRFSDETCYSATSMYFLIYWLLYT